MIELIPAIDLINGRLGIFPHALNDQAKVGRPAWRHTEADQNERIDRQH